MKLTLSEIRVAVVAVIGLAITVGFLAWESTLVLQSPCQTYVTAFITSDDVVTVDPYMTLRVNGFTLGRITQDEVGGTSLCWKIQRRP